MAIEASYLCLSSLRCFFNPWLRPSNTHINTNTKHTLTHTHMHTYTRPVYVEPSRRTAKASPCLRFVNRTDSKTWGLCVQTLRKITAVSVFFPLHSSCVANSLTCLQAKEYRTRFPFPHRIQALFRTNSQHPSLPLRSSLLFTPVRARCS